VTAPILTRPYAVGARGWEKIGWLSGKAPKREEGSGLNCKDKKERENVAETPFSMPLEEDDENDILAGRATW